MTQQRVGGHAEEGVRPKRYRLVRQADDHQPPEAREARVRLHEHPIGAVEVDRDVEPEPAGELPHLLHDPLLPGVERVVRAAVQRALPRRRARVQRDDRRGPDHPGDHHRVDPQSADPPEPDDQEGREADHEDPVERTHDGQEVQRLALAPSRSL